MAKRIAINGFGRIGRLTFRNLWEREDVEVVAVNDLAPNATLAHLLKYDSAHGIFPGEIKSNNGSLVVNGKEIKAYSERDPLNLPWRDLAVDLVLECTGVFRSKEKASLHLQAGAKDVLISAPAQGGDVQTIVLGVNHEDLDRRANVFSNASCTTNCFAPVIKIINDHWGLEFGSMTTIHAYTADQKIQDSPHKDLRRARAAAYNIVPTSTGAAKAVAKVVPEVDGKLSAFAVRVPVLTGSMIDVDCTVKKIPTVEEINSVFKSYADNQMKGVLEYTEDPIVSSDIVGNQHSSIFDSLMTSVTGNMIQVVSWYDNEAGYAARLADLAYMILTKKPALEFA